MRTVPRTRAIILSVATLAAAHTVSAQSTMTINQSGSQVVYTTLRAGKYADTNQGATLETKNSSDMNVTRRALLKFDTTQIPVGTAIASAKLTVTVAEGGATASRRVAAYQTTTSWTETEATWRSRRNGQSWSTSGGDLGAKLDTQVVGNSNGTRATFDVTPLVSQVVSGALGSSRYTRIALVDVDAADGESRRLYYTPDASGSLRPTLVVTFGSSSTTSSTSSDASSATTTSSLRVLEWNIYHGGIGTDGAYNPNRIADWIVKQKPDVVSLVEVESWDSYYSGDQVAMYKNLLESRTGVTWYALDIQKYGDWSSGGQRNALLSKFPFNSTYRHEFSVGDPRTVGGASIVVNGRTINVMSTHLDWVYQSNRIAQASELVSYATGFAQNLIITGDLNGGPGTTEINTIASGYYDAWSVAQSNGVAYSAPDNPNGNTRNSRIDYVFYSRGAQNLALKSVTVVDTRDSNGVMASDHRPVLAVFTVK